MQNENVCSFIQKHLNFKIAEYVKIEYIMKMERRRKWEYTIITSLHYKRGIILLKDRSY